MTPDTPDAPQSQPAPGAIAGDCAARLMQAALQTVSHGGFAGLTVDSLCARADATPADFGKHWSDPVDTFVDALDDRLSLPHLPDTGRLQDDLIAYLQAYLDRCSDPTVVASMVLALAHSRQDKALGAKLMPDYLRRRETNRILIDRAVDRGELPEDIDPDPILDALLGKGLAWMGIGYRPSPEEVEVTIRDLLAREQGPGASLLN